VKNGTEEWTPIGVTCRPCGAKNFKIAGNYENIDTILTEQLVLAIVSTLPFLGAQQQIYHCDFYTILQASL